MEFGRAPRGSAGPLLAPPLVPHCSFPWIDPPTIGMTETRHPRWMSLCLLAAGAYNLLWGGLTVLWPDWLFSLTGLEPPRYPFIWQCVGMIVGVYGIGYLAAARDPLRHWPIVLVGLLGKIFGPLGYLGGILQGTVPAAFGVTLPTNDLIWWVPFAMILWHAGRQNQGLADREPLSQQAAGPGELREGPAICYPPAKHGGSRRLSPAVDGLRHSP